MLRGLRNTSKIMMLIPLWVLCYDLVKEWFVNNRFLIRSLEKWWMWLDNDSFAAGKKAVTAVLGSKLCDKVMMWPAPVSLAIIPIVLYIIYWICFKIQGGQSTGAFTYKSRD